MFEAMVGSFVLVAASEMGDKTQLLAFSLASRFRKPWAVLAGIFVATVANHALASSLGSWVSTHVPARLMAVLLAVMFIGFGLWTLKPDTLDEDGGKPPRFGAFLTTVVLFFLAEMGDKTQLATMAVAARYQAPLTVTLGTTAGMLLSDGLAVFLGDRLAGRVQMKWVRWAAASLFFLFGAVSLWTALRMG
ncbi:TMEM165/GDT1 family protein [Myxococcus sp. RHSTA-1-4]|uniref:TMEM165/GDT1 family protein n=1 Tax=Myxococcus sp. RHSTA-1-4 TaxID=2874601 RepID=UPI001CBDDEDD|nr:TMEM165/GDT1 family protein [Myxococcus sp. RHSTA-1-4]MBZ4421742.1 TMEM165/GDT1 family protein [Myxococcus sp. RHSTA-1-4]